MTTSNGVGIELPEWLRSNSETNKKNKTGKELPEHTMQFYIDEREKRALKDEMIKGYQEMGDINLSICEEFFASEAEVWCDN